MSTASLVFSQVSPFLQIFGSATASYEKLEGAMKRSSMIDGTQISTELSDVDGSGEISIQQVSFTYPSRPGVKVLDGVSIDIQGGKHTAIVGLSGSGKSTIAALLSRLYDPSQGYIMLGAKDIRHINVRQLRGLVGLVQQDALLLDRSVLENIALGLTNSPDHQHLHDFILGPALSEIASSIRGGEGPEVAAGRHGTEATEILGLVRAAAELADVQSFLGSLDHGIGTEIGPSGNRLSGGQKQRVALARALVKNPKILVLDEATASLDSATEQRIQKAMRNIISGRTVVTIAHRLATVRHAHKIVVMRDGKFVEEGSHGELLAKDGHYAALLRLQTTTQSSDAEDDDDDSEGDDEKAVLVKEDEHASAGKAGSYDKVRESTAPAEADKTEPGAGFGQKTTGSILKGLSGIMRPHLLILVAAFLSSLIVGGAYSGEAVIFGFTIDDLSPCSSADAVRYAGSFFGLMLFALALIELFANGISWSAFGWVAEKTLYVVRVLSFRSLFEQDMHWHGSQNRTPSLLLNFITEDSSALGGLTGSVIGTIFSISVNLVVAIILTHIVAWKIALVCLAAVPLMLGSGVMQLRELARFEEKHEQAFARSISITVEAVNTIKAAAALSLEQEILNTYRRSLKAPRKETAKASAYANFWLSFSYSMGNFIYALAYWWGAKLIIAGEYTPAQFFIVVIALLVSAQLWSQMFTLAPEVSRAKGAIGRILGLIDAGSSRTLDPEPGESRGKEKDVEAALGVDSPLLKEADTGLSVSFDNVRFSYPGRPNHEVLKGLDIVIQPGQFAALVGPSGAGKSTILALLERMYPLPANSGTITLSGLDIARAPSLSFRDAIGLVPQSPVLFDGTVAFNISLGGAPPPAPAPSRPDVEEACRLAHMHDAVAALPQGYDTPCGAGGGQLSGGQRQRLAIARALVRRPRLLLLDEGTSALDAESEAALREGLDAVRAGGRTTVLAVAHRLHTIRQADVIFLVEDGRCVDRGRHEELIVRSEAYRAAVAHQEGRGVAEEEEDAGGM
jgi:ATP-binding cassette, subfamily B (MDR/TAP), member 1